MSAKTKSLVDRLENRKLWVRANYTYTEVVMSFYNHHIHYVFDLR